MNNNNNNTREEDEFEVSLTWAEDVLSQKEHDAIVKELEESKDWQPVHAESRCVLQFGYAYDYASHGRTPLKETKAIPEFLRGCVREAESRFPGVKFNQVIVNRYLPGQGISAHIDRDSFGPFIVCFSLGTVSGRMVFRNGDKKFELEVPPRSLYAMTGEARYKYTHEMKPVPKRGQKLFDKPRVRYSITLRTVLK